MVSLFNKVAALFRLLLTLTYRQYPYIILNNAKYKDMKFKRTNSRGIEKSSINKTQNSNFPIRNIDGNMQKYRYLESPVYVVILQIQRGSI